jgi:acetyl-CoA synthetase
MGSSRERIEMDGEIFLPSDEVVARTKLKDWAALDASARSDPEGFWAAEAAELEWFEPWKGPRR